MCKSIKVLVLTCEHESWQTCMLISFLSKNTKKTLLICVWSVTYIFRLSSSMLPFFLIVLRARNQIVKSSLGCCFKADLYKSSDLHTCCCSHMWHKQLWRRYKGGGHNYWTLSAYTSGLCCVWSQTAKNQRNGLSLCHLDLSQKYLKAHLFTKAFDSSRSSIYTHTYT